MRIPKSKALYVSAAMFALLGSSTAVAHAAYKTVTVQDNGQRKTIRGFTFGTLGSFLESEHIAVPPRSRVVPSLATAVQTGMNVVIQRPIEVQVIDGGAMAKVETLVGTVGQFLHEQGITLGSNDRISQSLSSPLQDGEVIQIRRTTTHAATKTEVIPFQTIRRPTDTLFVGETRLLTHGVKGLLEVQTTTVFVDGHKTGQTQTRRMEKPVVNQVIEVGTAQRPVVLASRSSGPISALRQLTVVATAYASGGHTSTGWRAVPGVIAVDPAVIPLGTKLYIPGIGVVHAEDTGTAIRGNRIDICMSTLAQADAWGVRTITLYEIQ